MFEQTDAELYRLGAKCLRLSQAYTRTRLLTRHARPILVALSRETGETAHLAVLSAFEVVHLDGEQAAGMIAGTLRVGDRLPSHCTALGKVLLAGLPKDDLEPYVATSLERFTPETITEPDLVRAELDDIRGRGWALARQELEEGLNAIAAPVRDQTGEVVAALSVSGPTFRLDDDRMRELVGRVTDAADRISMRLGHAG